MVVRDPCSPELVCLNNKPAAHTISEAKNTHQEAMYEHLLGLNKTWRAEFRREPWRVMEQTD